MIAAVGVSVIATMVRKAMVYKYYVQIISQNKVEIDEHQEQRR